VFVAIAEYFPETRGNRMARRKTKRTPRQAVAVKSNDLIEARYSLSLTEQRLFLAALSQILPEDEDLRPYRVDLAEYIQMLPSPDRGIYSEVRLLADRLTKVNLDVPRTENGVRAFKFYSLFSTAEYVDGEGAINLTFNPALKPFLTQLKERFTPIEIKNVFQLQSAHSARIYELLKQYEKVGQRVIGVDDLRGMLRLEDSYRSYTMFKKRVIEQAQEDLEANADIKFAFTELKSGKRVMAIRFHILPNNPSEKPPARASSGVSAKGSAVVEPQASLFEQEQDPFEAWYDGLPEEERQQLHLKAGMGLSETGILRETAILTRLRSYWSDQQRGADAREDEAERTSLPQEEG
jgi:plasmid replication initiation protein